MADYFGIGRCFPGSIQRELRNTHIVVTLLVMAWKWAFYPGRCIKDSRRFRSAVSFTENFRYVVRFSADLDQPLVSRTIISSHQLRGEITLTVKFAALMLYSGLFLAQPGTMDVPVNEPHVVRVDENITLTGQMETISTPSRQEFQVYVTGSPDSKRGLLLVHEWWGLTEHIKAEADYWATRGYRVMAPDLYDGRIAHTSREGARYMHAIDQRIANNKLGAVLKAIRMADMPVFALGWCFGGVHQ